MAEKVLEPVVGDVVERVIALAVDEVGLLLCVKGEVKKLRTVLTSIQAVLQDAEEKQVKERNVKVWLQELKQVAYDAEDVLDEIAYKKLKYEIINKASRWFSRSRLIVHVKMVHKIKAINGRLDVIEKNKNRFQLEPNQSGSSSLDQMITYDRETCAYVNYSNVLGRESETEKIIKKLINDDESSSSTDRDQVSTGNNIALPVIAIVGLGGLGKTTLAQLVYNDAVVEKHFELRVWICVSTNFRTTNLFFQIIQQINRNNTKPESSSKQVLLDELKSQLKQQEEKKFLLALDDDWNEEQRKWEDFVFPLRDFVATGSRIIVTSRNSNVASIRGAQTMHVHQLQDLSEDSCWDIIKSQAFKKGEYKKASLVEIGKQISKKCKPLAAKVLGGLLQPKKEDREWKAVRDAEFWNLPSDGTEQILEVLKLSYYNLPSTLRSCFSYCAIFPKDYWISKALLIELWMAQGLLGAEVMEDVGNTYFNILYSKSFFQEAEINEYKEVIRCKMHDLVNDLAQSICKFECQNFGESNTMRAVDFSKCRHPPVISPVIVKDLCKAMKMRTIFGWGSTSIEFNNGGTVGATKISTFFKFKLLRVLDLSGFRGYDFSFSLGTLKHLRYLDLSKMSIESLQKWVAKLYSLQTLKLIKCEELKELPEDLMNLKKLRHLFIDEYKKWKKMPQAMGELHQLQTLPLFVVCEEDAGRGISVLKNLNNLRGSLKIHRLCLVKEVSLAKGAKLSDKGLLLTNDDEMMVANSSSLLRILKIWKCDALKSIPNLRGFTSLQQLNIWSCGKLETIPKGFLSSLVALEKLIVCGCDRLKGTIELLPPSLKHLQHLQVRECPNFEGFDISSNSSSGSTEQQQFALFPCCHTLQISDCEAISSINVQSFASLRQLEVKSCSGLKALQGLRFLRAIESLDLGPFSEDLDCFPLLLLDDGGDADDDNGEVITLNTPLLPSLRELEIEGWAALQSLPRHIQHLTMLRSLTIGHFTNLTKLPEWLGNLASLEKLYIRLCKNFTDLPSKKQMQRLTLLNQVIIYNCPQLKERCSNSRYVSEWTKISYL